MIGACACAVLTALICAVFRAEMSAAATGVDRPPNAVRLAGHRPGTCLKSTSGLGSTRPTGQVRAHTAFSRSANCAKVVAGLPVRRRMLRLGSADTFIRTTRYAISCASLYGANAPCSVTRRAHAPDEPST